MPVCDICEKPMEWGQGYGLNTTQVTTSEGYWKYLLSSTLWKQLHDQSPEGNNLSNLIQRQGNDSTAWLICDKCGELLDFDHQSARKYNKKGVLPPGLGPANLSLVAISAAYAWSELYNSWPLSVQIQEAPPKPGEISNCDFCKRPLGDEKIALLKESVVKAYESLGGLKRRCPASQNINGNMFWIACSLCISRANRITGEMNVSEDLEDKFIEKKRKWWQIKK